MSPDNTQEISFNKNPSMMVQESIFLDESGIDSFKDIQKAEGENVLLKPNVFNTSFNTDPKVSPIPPEHKGFVNVKEVAKNNPLTSGALSEVLEVATPFFNTRFQPAVP